jgi:hypothetical protein
MSALCVLVQTSLCVSSVLTHRRIHFGCVWWVTQIICQGTEKLPLFI